MSIKVFIADDHAILRDGLRLFLESQSDMHVVGEAENGREAIAKIRECDPDVVILDVAMPDLNGIDTLPHILEINPNIRVIFLSMLATSEYITNAFNRGAKGYLVKATASVELLQAVRAVYKGERYLCSKLSDLIVTNYIQTPADQPVQQTDPFQSLSHREREILQMIVEGKSSKEIAQILYIAPGSVKTYRSRLMKKLNATTLAHLTKIALAHGLTPE